MIKFPIIEGGENMTMETKIQLTHFPIVLNHCTTGHKLQGKSLDQLVITEWNKTQNWGYVVLSRVRTLEGLFLIKPLPLDMDFSPDSNYLEMMERLRKNILASTDDVTDLTTTLEIQRLQ